MIFAWRRPDETWPGCRCLPPAAASAPAEVLRHALREEDAAAFSARFPDTDPALLGALFTGPADGPRWPAADRPGVYRREHASVLIRSRAASVVLDPLRLGIGHFPEGL